MKSESPAPKGKAITSTSDSSGQPAGSPATLAEWAAHYAQTGLEVFPVDPETKAPIGATEGANGETIWMATKGHTSATTDAAIIASWWQLRPDALIGCRIPKDMVVLDIDPRHDGLDTWDTIVAGHDLPTTRLHKSGRNDGGFHIWFQHPDLARIDAGDGIDVLTWGHRYTILPPSPHPATGSPYFWVQSSEDSDVADHARMANRTTHTGPQSAGGATRPTHHPKPHTRRPRANPGRMVQRQRLLVRDPDRMAASSRQRRRRRLQMGPPNGNGRIFRNDPARMLVCVLTDARVAGHRNERPERPNKI